MHLLKHLQSSYNIEIYILVKNDYYKGLQSS